MSVKIFGRVAVAAVIVALVFGVFGVEAAQRPQTQVITNVVERWVTNAIEVRVPVTRFVNEYHTNVVQRVTTNVVDSFATNVVTRTVTNHVFVTLTQTNFVRNFQTNYKTLNLTNWNAVLVLKTNWVSQGITNVVEVDMPKVAAQPLQSPSSDSVAVAAPAAAEALVIEGRRGGKSGGPGNIPVELKARWSNGGKAAQVQQWRIEREVGSFLCFGQEQEFQRPLPPGTYKVQVKARAADSSAIVTVKAKLVVSNSEVLIQQGMLAIR